MRKIAMFLVALLLVSTLAYAQVARNSETTTDPAKSNVSNIGVTGLDVTGNPGYVELYSTNSGGTVYQWYLWVDTTGDLRIASRTTMETMASFPSGDWRLPNFNVGTVVGSQS
jgi:hypothetical protein